MPKLPEDFSKTADVDWGFELNEEQFRRSMHVLMDAYVADGPGPGKGFFAVEGFALYISTAKGWDEAYRWIYEGSQNAGQSADDGAASR